MEADFLKKSTQDYGHNNCLRTDGKTDDSLVVSNKGHYDVLAFVEATASPIAAARTYLHQANGVLHIAIDRYLGDNQKGEDETDDDVEEIPR